MSLLRLWVAAALLAPAIAAAQAPALPKIEIASKTVEFDGSPSLSTDLVFEIGEPAIRPAAVPLLDALAKVLAADPSPRIAIGVHADDAAPDNDHTGAWLLKLTQRRADALKAHFAKRGVPGRRLAATGHGSTRPVGDNQTESGKRANRRVEIVVESDVRPPTAADLPGYLKAVRGTGPKLVATIATNKGTLRCELFDQQAPMTVANFIGLATGQKPWLDPKTKKIVKGKPFYDGLTFHRVIPQFMIQGGDPLGIGSGGPGYTFGDETSPALTHQPGTLSMANAGPSTNGSQFFITEVTTPHLNGRHTVFGHCKELEVITAIAGVPRSSGGGDAPSDPVTITKLTIARGAQ